MEFDPIRQAEPRLERFNQRVVEAMHMLGLAARRELNGYMKSIPESLVPMFTLPGNELPYSDHRIRGFLVGYESEWVAEVKKTRHIVITKDDMVIADSVFYANGKITHAPWEFMNLGYGMTLTDEQANKWAVYGRQALLNLAGRETSAALMAEAEKREMYE